ncbi:MAG: ATP-binding protein, partial [Bacteroidota bacterium]
MTYIQPFLQHPLILVFMITNLAIGWWAHRKAKAGSFEDYAMASRNLPTGVLIMTILATVVSSRELAIIDTTTLKLGIIIPILILAHFIISTFFIGFFLSPKLVFFEGPTLGGVMQGLYGRWSQLLSGIIHCLFCLALVITQISAIGLLSTKLWGMNFTIGVVFFGGIAVLYSTFGGMRSVSYTDVLQLVVLLIVLFWTVQKVVLHTGGILPLVKKVAQQEPDKLSFFSRSDFFLRIKGLLVYYLFSCYLVMSPPLTHRMLVVKDKSKVSRTWYTTALIYAVIAGMFLIIGLFGITQKEKLGLAKSKDVFIQVVKYLFKNNPRILDFIALGIIGILLSTIDSFLHTMGITAIKDVIVPIQRLLDKKILDERRQLNYAKISIFIIGMIAVAIGTRVEHESVRLIRRTLIVPIMNLQVIITIPFILGVMGLKGSKSSFISFVVAYCSVFYGQKTLFPWRHHLRHLADRDYFLIALPLALLAYFITHIYLNKGIAIVTRGKNYTAHKVVKPRWEKIQERILQWVKATFNLPALARQEVFKRPSHPLVFSVFMFVLYGLGSSVGGSQGEGGINFMMLIYFIGISLCAGLMIEGIWPLRLKLYFPLYWLTTIFFCLPLGGTIAFIQTHTTFFDMLLFLLSFIFLAFLVSSRAFIWMSIWGIALTCGGWYVVYGALPETLWSEAHMGVYIVWGMLALFVLFFGQFFETYVSQQLYLKKVFGQTMTHDARHPLSDITLSAYIQDSNIRGLTPTKNEAGEEGFFLSKKKVASMQDESKKIDQALKELNRDFMHFERLISKEIGQVPREKVYMKSFIDYIVLALPKRYASQVEVKVECKKDFQGMLIRPFFTNVIFNFVVNAWKHGLATQMVIEIDGSERKVRIRDNGRGIPAELLPNVFNLGFTTGDQENRGVGLAFVKLILDASNIKVDVTSKQGEGSFTEFVLAFDSG